jgi:hypothetical protein
MNSHCTANHSFFTSEQNTYIGERKAGIHFGIELRTVISARAAILLIKIAILHLQRQMASGNRTGNLDWRGMALIYLLGLCGLAEAMPFRSCSA